MNTLIFYFKINIKSLFLSRIKFSSLSFNLLSLIRVNPFLLTFYRRDRLIRNLIEVIIINLISSIMENYYDI